MLYFTDILPHEILFIFYVFHLNNYDFASNVDDLDSQIKYPQPENCLFMSP
jgi:hypothetical protein